MKNSTKMTAMALASVFALGACTDPGRIGAQPGDPNQRTKNGALIGAGAGALPAVETYAPVFVDLLGQHAHPGGDERDAGLRSSLDRHQFVQPRLGRRQEVAVGVVEDVFVGAETPTCLSRRS